MHRTPDIYRAFAPGSTAEVKRRARQRMDDGLPTLDGGPDRNQVVDAVEVPPVLAAVEAAFRAAGDPERMPTVDLLAALESDGWELDAQQLADELRPVGLRPDARWRPTPGANSIRGYLLADMRAAIGRLS